MNKPYIKQLDSLGICQNPIEKHYSSRTFLGMEKDEKSGEFYPVYYPNRRERRAKKPRLKARYGTQFVQQIVTATLNGVRIPLNEVINYVLENEKIVFTTKQVVHTRFKG